VRPSILRLLLPALISATASDFVPATQCVYCSPDLPSHLVLPILP